MNAGKVHGKHIMMYGAAISGHLLILCMCVLSWFVFFATQDCPRPYQKNIPQRIKNAGHHLSYRWRSSRITCVARTQWNGGLLHGQSAEPISRNGVIGAPFFMAEHQWVFLGVK